MVSLYLKEIFSFIMVIRSKKDAEIYQNRKITGALYISKFDDDITTLVKDYSSIFIY